MFHDVGIWGRLRSLANAFYPPVFLVLRIVFLGRIRGQGHVRVARGCQWLSLSLLFPFAVTRAGASAPVVVLLALFSCSSHAGGGRGLLTAPALGVGALSLAVTALDPGIETGRVVPGGGGRLTAPGLVIGVRVFSLPAGGSGVTASGRTLSCIARGHASVYLAPARLRAVVPGQLARREAQEGVEGCLTASCGF